MNGHATAGTRRLNDVPGTADFARANSLGCRASALAEKATFVRDPYVSYPRRLIFWFFGHVISPHKQGSFDFSRARLAFFREEILGIGGPKGDAVANISANLRCFGGCRSTCPQKRPQRLGGRALRPLEGVCLAQTRNTILIIQDIAA
jgi:hypothetical protein